MLVMQWVSVGAQLGVGTDPVTITSLPTPAPRFCHGSVGAQSPVLLCDRCPGIKRVERAGVVTEAELCLLAACAGGEARKGGSGRDGHFFLLEQ